MSWNLKMMGSTTLLLTAAVGCSTVARLFDGNDGAEKRSQRFFDLAAQYDQQGQHDAAIRIYDHLLALQPENTVARDRRELLVQQERQTFQQFAAQVTAPTPVARNQLRRPRTPQEAASRSLEQELLLCEQLRPEGVVSTVGQEPAIVRRPYSARFSGRNTANPIPFTAEHSQVAALASDEQTDAAWTPHEASKDDGPSLSILQEHLSRGDEQLVCLACYQLGLMGPDAMVAVPALYKLLHSSHDVTRLCAAEAVLKIDPHSQPPIKVLVTALSDEDRNVRWLSVQILGSVPLEAQAVAAKALRIALHDIDPAIRATACLGLGGLTEHGLLAVDELRRLAQSDDPEVKLAAEVSLHCLLRDPSRF